jgi:hypothetical protein
VPLQVQATVEVGRPAGIPEGSDVDHNIAINLAAGLPLQPGRHAWRLSVNGTHDEAWSAPFFVRPQ